jgi:UDP-glucose 4-epimerase
MKRSLHKDEREIILVTGGAGYIGSHACVELLQAGYQVVVVDNLSNSNKESLDQIEKITGQSIDFFEIDIRDRLALLKVFSQYPISAVMHFAGLKAVGESCEQPLNYYQNNVHGLMVLVDVLAESNVKKLVFSSSATVYGNNSCVQYSETQPIGATNPYGRTKEIIEKILTDLSAADQLLSAPNPWKISLLRYFNPIGAHESGLIGENPKGIPNNLMPYLGQVAIGKLKQLSIFGNDYPTKDGTGIRDYIHVVDLVKGHIKALEALNTNAYNKGGCRAHNLGSGKGYSVLDVIQTFEKVTGQKINFKFAPRRSGDLAEFFANPSLAARDLNWKVEKNLEEMVADTWRWQQQSNQILSR